MNHVKKGLSRNLVDQEMGEMREEIGVLRERTATRATAG